MRLQNVQSVECFKEAVDRCEGDVWLNSATEHYNIKSAISFMIAVGKVLSGNKDLELFASSKDDEHILLQMFNTHPEML